MAAIRDGILKNKILGRALRWMDAMPHPCLAIEIASDRISAVRWSPSGTIEKIAIEPVPAGAIVPSAVEANIVDAASVGAALEAACSSVQASGEEVALLLPDSVIRAFVLHFDDFPRAHSDVVAFLRWKLKKSMPFDMADASISYVRQVSSEPGVHVVVVVARLRVVREYEDLAESLGIHPGVVLSSSLAALSLLEDPRPTLLARISDKALTTVVVRDGAVCGYRCTELPGPIAELTPQMLLEEIYPVAAYYQDALKSNIELVSLSGVGELFPKFAGPIENEFHCKVQPLLNTPSSGNRIAEDARRLAESHLDGLVGWMLSGDLSRNKSV